MFKTREYAMRAFLIFLLITFSSASYADELSVSDIDEEIAFKYTQELCSVMLRSEINNKINVPARFEEITMSYSETSPVGPKKLEKMANYVNKHMHLIVCRAVDGAYGSPEHIFIRTLKQNLHKPVLFDFFLQDSENFPVDFNITQIDCAGKRTTLLGYINEILADPERIKFYNRGQILRLRATVKRRMSTIGEPQGEQSPQRTDKMRFADLCQDKF